MIASGIVELLRRDRRTAGYHKLFETTNNDGRFVRELTGSPSSASGELPAPVIPSQLPASIGTGSAALVSAAKDAGSHRDLLIVDGPSSLSEGRSLGTNAGKLANELDAHVILVAPFDDHLIDDVLTAKDVIGDRLQGLVINRVPAKLKDRAKAAADLLAGEGISLLGILPYEDVLASVTVRQLAEHLGGQIMNSIDKADELIEHFMVGTVVLGKASDYFRRRSRKAVIAHGSRPDMHLAALETDTRCIVLAGNVVPNPIVVARAEEEEVPLILVKEDTLAVLESIEELYPAGRFAQLGKVGHAADLIKNNLSLPSVFLPALA